MTPCSIDGCDKAQRYSRLGWCGMHYSRWRKHGTTDPNPLAVMRNADPLTRFWTKVDKSGDCWLWTAERSHDGYPRFNLSGSERVYAHRFAYEQMVAPIPDGLELDHLCRVRHCVNPAHLEPVTGLVNQHRSPLTLTSVNAAKTHCPRGHPYEGDNLLTRATGRVCRECKRALDRESQRRYRAKKKEAS